MATDYGIDILCTSDLDPYGQTTSGVANVKQALLHRFETPRGTYWYDPDPAAATYGVDLRDYLNAEWTASASAQMQADMQAQAVSDPRVSAAFAALTYNSQTRSIKANLTIQVGNATVPLVLLVTSVSVSVIG